MGAYVRFAGDLRAHQEAQAWRYETHYELVTDAPTALPEGAILQRCIDLLEADIRETPHQWLWSHKRWKHARPETMPLNPRPESETKFGDDA